MSAEPPGALVPLRPYAPLLAAEDVGPGLARGQEVKVTVPALAGWRPRTIAERFARAFGRKLVVMPSRA